MTTENKNMGSEEAKTPVTLLTAEECWMLAEQTDFARLGTIMGDKVSITPINITNHRGKIYFRTAAGSKLTHLLINKKVTLQFDSLHGDEAYSVSIRGQARLLTDLAELEEARSLNLKPWSQTTKIEFVEITPNSLTGRLFQLNR